MRDAQRFMDNVAFIPFHECWEWTGPLMRNGYGRIRVYGRETRAHRASWLIHRGPIPEGPGFHGTCVMHRCDNKQCVNPGHLMLGTQAENLQDMARKNRRAIGTRHPASKLTPDKVHEIRAAVANGERQHIVAKRYGIGQVQVSRLVLRKQWRHI